MKFLPPEVGLYLYKYTIRPCMEYCCHVWTGAPSCCLQLLDKIQKRIGRTVSHLGIFFLAVNCTNGSNHGIPQHVSPCVSNRVVQALMVFNGLNSLTCCILLKISFLMVLYLNSFHTKRSIVPNNTSEGNSLSK